MRPGTGRGPTPAARDPGRERFAFPATRGGSGGGRSARAASGARP